MEKPPLLPIAALAAVSFAPGCRDTPPSIDAGARAPVSAQARRPELAEGRPSATVPPEPSDGPEARALRAALVAQLERGRDLRDPRVVDALRAVPRHHFVPAASLAAAYADVPLPIGEGQTISQPAVVASMTQALELRGGERVLEIGTGSGYQAAVLSLLAARVWSIELIARLGERARARLAQLGYANVEVRVGDGYAGWPDQAPFDRILLTAAPPEVPEALVDQLAEGGVLVAPVGPEGETQKLLRLRKTRGSITREDLGRVVFVPMVRGR